jgi:hypothetical protein
MDTKILKRLIRKKYGKYRPNAAEILKIIEDNNLRPKRRGKRNEKK